MAKPYGRTKVQENEDGKSLLGGGCETCPVVACATTTYRGSACASQRATYGLGDPMTNSDRIRAKSDEELAEFLANMLVENRMWDFVPPGHNFTATQSSATKHTWFCTLYKWLKQPVEE